jgi:transcription initiation factor TFIIB
VSEDYICSKCGGFIIFDPKIGEVVCSKCGYVPALRRVVHSPEWKAIDPEDKLRKSRVGPPVTLTRHDMGLSTDLGIGDYDIHGLPIVEKDKVRRMRIWQSRMRAKSGKEKSMAHILSKISEFSSLLNLPQNVQETASYILRRAMKKGLTSKRSISGMAAATLYIACRQCGVNRSMKEISRVSNVKPRLLGTYYRYLINEIGEVKIPPTPIEKLVMKISNRLRLSTRTTRLAVKMVRKMKDPDLISGRQPAGLAAAFLYLSASLYDEPVLQKDIASIAGVTEVTIRKRCREILETYDVSVALK